MMLSMLVSCLNEAELPGCSKILIEVLNSPASILLCEVNISIMRRLAGYKLFKNSNTVIIKNRYNF